MSTKGIKKYRMKWGCQQNQGRIQLQLEDDSDVELEINSPAEFSAICAFLERGPLKFDPSGQTLISASETVST